MTCRIRSNSGSDVNVQVEDNRDGTFSIYYTVKDVGEYTLNVKYGGQPVPNGVYTFKVSDVFLLIFLSYNIFATINFRSVHFRCWRECQFIHSDLREAHRIASEIAFKGNQMAERVSQHLRRPTAMNRTEPEVLN